jgi:hypothetical protein
MLGMTKGFLDRVEKWMMHWPSDDLPLLGCSSFNYSVNLVQIFDCSNDAFAKAFDNYPKTRESERKTKELPLNVFDKIVKEVSSSTQYHFTLRGLCNKRFQ